MNFNQWIIEKKVKNSDLVFLNAFKSQEETDLFNSIADKICLHNPSFSSGLQTLEWAADLILAQTDTCFITENNFNDFDSLKIEIRKNRYPNTTHFESDHTQWLQSLHWPNGAKPKIERRGDRFGAEIKFFISNELDITKAIAGLERLKIDYLNQQGLKK